MLGDHGPGGVPLRIRSEGIAGFRRREQVGPGLVGDPVATLARGALSGIERHDRIIAGERGCVAVWIRQERLLLFGGGEEIGSAAMPHAPLGTALDPHASLRERHGAITLQADRHGTVGIGLHRGGSGLGQCAGDRARAARSRLRRRRLRE